MAFSPRNGIPKQIRQKTLRLISAIAIFIDHLVIPSEPNANSSLGFVKQPQTVDEDLTKVLHIRQGQLTLNVDYRVSYSSCRSMSGQSHLKE